MRTASLAPAVAVIVGNPRPGSRTLSAACHVANRLTSADPLVVDLATLGSGLLDPADPAVADVVERVKAVDVVVAASPTYTATYTGLLKVFLDRLGHQALKGKVAVPLMLGGAPVHSLAAELLLRPVLTGLGAVVPAPALFVLETAYDDAATYDEWVRTAGPLVHAVLDAWAAQPASFSASPS
jgi:FMN reductase